MLHVETTLTGVLFTFDGTLDDLQDAKDYQSEHGDDSTFLDVLFEQYLCNGWQVILPESIGALTDGLIITDGTNIFWDSVYQVISTVDKLLNGQSVTWQSCH
jgi:hypothetical protein